MNPSNPPGTPDPAKSWVTVLVNQALDDLAEHRLTPEQALRTIATAAWDAGWDAAREHLSSRR